ncbi:COMM domain-containing protein 4 [Episyrphus balteatus]|uniref:COMM domain-containing protein 4 n=1 Tax=Episyrphus balteatus TaxID=286459 RepID=UPI002485A7D1|nr:COMM domain-containing protein 4 [Episyrphus balteatus]
MKFRFCGDGDCPDWILAEIISTLSVLDSKKFMDLASIVAKKIIGEPFEESGVRSITSTLEDDGKSAVACINYLLISAARHSTDGTVFNEELQQLGLPKDHAAVMCRVLSDYSAPIRKKLMGLSLKINELGSVSFNKPDNTIDCVQLELEVLQELNGAGLPMDVIHKVNIDSANLRALLKDMKEAREIIREYDFEGKYYKDNMC